MIDFRSDTVTKPTQEMKEFMFNAPLGDDVLGDDPSVIELENLAASMFGMEAGLFCSSGTMTNQIAIKAHTNPGDELICHEEAHIYRYEGGGIARNSGVSTRFLRGNNGRINPNEIIDNINPKHDVHYPLTSLVCIEDTANRGGGVYYDFNEIKQISNICKENKLPLHLDGARVFNALVETGIDYKEYGKQFDSISICLSKGLGAPVGSVLIGTKEFIAKARRIRKVFGGGMRQAGIIAAAGTYALQNNIERLKEDHKKAKQLEEILIAKEWIKEVIPVQTNIVVGILADNLNEYDVVAKIKEAGILCSAFGKGRIRFTTHLDITENDIEVVKNKLPNVI